MTLVACNILCLIICTLFLQQARHRLPAQFSHLSDLKDMNGRWSRKSPKNRKGNILSNYKDANGFQENCVGVIHPLVRGSHDSVWHKAEGQYLCLKVRNFMYLCPCLLEFLSSYLWMHTNILSAKSVNISEK